MAKKKRKIIDIEIEEISLVDSAANRKKFYLKKRGTPMDKLKKLLKSILGEDPSEIQVQKLQAQPPADTESLTGALVILEKYQEDLPEDLAESTVSLVKYAIAQPALEDEAAFNLEKVGARLSKATKEDLVKIKALVDKMLEADKPAPEKTEKYAALPADIRARLEAIDEQERLEKKAKETALETENVELKKTVTDLLTRVEKMEKRRISKQTAGDEETEEEDPEVEKKNKTLWPSLAGPIIAPREG